MSEKQARQRRQHRMDPRRYQLVLLAAIEWDVVLKAGQCAQCQRQAAAPRHRFLVHDGGLLNHLTPRRGERAADHGERALVEMNRRQYEGDFGLALPPRAFCEACAWAMITGVASAIESADYAQSLLPVIAAARLSGVLHGTTAFSVLTIAAEPGADNWWHLTCVSGPGRYDAASAYRMLRRDLDAGHDSLDGGFRVLTPPTPPTVTR